MNYAPVGRFVKTHGIAGALSAEFYCDNVGEITALGPFFLSNGEALELEVISKGKKVTRINQLENSVSCIVRINNLEVEKMGARKFVGQDIMAERSDFKSEGEVYEISALIGLQVVVVDDRTRELIIASENEKVDIVGEVISALDFGAGPMLEISFTDKKRFQGLTLFQFKNEYFPHIDLDLGIILLNPPIVETLESSN